MARNLNPFQAAQQAAEEPKVSFDFNQKVLVFLEDKPLDYIPCLPVSEQDVTSRIPHKSWIKYRGLARVDGVVYMRFEYDGTQVYVGMGFLPFLENIPQRNPNEKPRVPKNRSRTVKSVKPKGLRAKRKPGVRRKKAS